MAHKFFISYSRSVRPEIKRLVDFLRAEGHDVWWDADILPGQPWWGTIVDKIIWCDIFIFVVSEKSVQSPYCLAEVKFATSRNRPILPFIIDAQVTYTIPPEITPKLNQWLPYNGNMDDTTREILRASAHLGVYHDIKAPRPPEPGKEHATLSKQFQHAVELAEDRHFDEALKHFRQIEALDPQKWGDDCREWLSKITLYCEIAELAEHNSTLKKARREWKTYADTYSDDNELFDPLHIAKKVASVTKASSSMPLHSSKEISAEGYFTRGLNRPDEDTEGKIADYTEALRLEPRPDIYFERGSCYYDGQDYDKAILDYNEALQLDRQFSVAYYQRARCYHKKGDYSRAITDYDAALNIDPRYSFAKRNRQDAIYALEAQNKS